MKKISKGVLTICMLLSFCLVYVDSIKAECNHEYVCIYEYEATCEYEGYREWECKYCYDWYYEYTDPALGHDLHYVGTKASFTSDGTGYNECSRCGGTSSTFTIYHASDDIEVKKTKFVYDGKGHYLTVNRVKDSYYYYYTEDDLVKGKDYTLVNNATRKEPGVYTVTVKLMGDYYEGSKKITYSIVPKAVAPTIKLCGYDDILVSWSKSYGAKGYRVYYRKTSSSSWKHVDTTGTSKKLMDLADGAKYEVKVCPYVVSAGGTKYINTNSPKIKSIFTLKKIGKPAIYKYNKKKVKIRWKNIDGETGYQISRSTSSTGTKVVSTIATTKGDGKILDVVEGKKYYYKVRAYRTVDGKKKFGPWSVAKAYTCGKTPSSGIDKTDPIVKACLAQLGKHGLCSEIESNVVQAFIKSCWNNDSTFFYFSNGSYRKVTSPIPGDIVYYDSVPPSNVNHEAIYLGNGKCLHGNWGASSSGNVWDGMGTAQIGELYIKGASKPQFYRIK